MNRTVVLIIGLAILFLIDVYLFRSFMAYLNHAQRWAKYLYTIVWWIIPVLSVVLVLSFGKLPKWAQLYTMNGLGILFFTKVLAFLLMMIGEGWFGIFSLFQDKTEYSAAMPSRRLFIARLGTVAAALPFFTMGYGLLRTAYDFRIHRVKMRSPKVPEAFRGFKIVQISDVHTGSWIRHSAMQQAIDLIHAQKPDLIVFTGDIVNNRTDEAIPFVSMLSRLRAPYGVYSVLGNHDYGDYENWPDEASKKANMEAMYHLHKNLNWDLLLNEHRLIEKDGQQIALIGVENWGAALRFPKYGRLGKASAGTENIPFKILLSHDPSHWDAEIVPKFSDIDLTLSGHTHGFQFGVEIPGFKWSPSQYLYRQWAGLYRHGSQYIYVNRGTGCLGYSGRIGIKPEITVIELENGTM